MEASTRAVLDTLAKSVSTPIEEARGLPTEAYLSEEIFQLEIEHIFHKDWVCVGREEEAESPGDFFAFDLVGEPLLIVRGADRQLRALSNVCRHRYMQLVEGQGSAEKLVCPYHGWTYQLDGTLAGAPHMSESRIFERRSCRLPEFRLETWLGFVFVNLDPDAEPLAPRLESLQQRLAPYKIEQMRLVALYDKVWEGNWKLTMENNAEAHHHLTLHPETLEPWMPGHASHCPEDAPGWTLLVTPLAFEKLRADAPSYAGLMERYSAGIDPQDQTDTLTYFFYPAATLDATPGLVFWKRILPIDRSRARVRIGALVYPEERSPELRRETEEFFELLNTEDYEATWKLQRTIGSRYAEPGPLSVKEGCLLHFHRYLAKRLSEAR